VECDPAMKQFLLHLDEKLTLGSSFVIQVVKFEGIIVISIQNVIKASQLLLTV
jgi:hypothetical protein